MSLRFISSVLCTGALIATVSSAPAFAADRDDVGRFLGAAATLFIIGKIIQSESRDDAPAARVVTRQKTVTPQRRHVAPRRADLPRACLIPVSQGAGTRYVMGARCLERNFRSARRLPSACRVTLRGARHDRNGYSVRCLRNNGFQVASR